MRPTTNPVLAALAQARMRAAPMFVKWCELNGLSPCPAAPAHVARFVVDCAPLGIQRLWPAIQDVSMALDPTITFTGATTAPSISVKPIPAVKPAAPSIASPARGSTGAFVAAIFNAVFRRKK